VTEGAKLYLPTETMKRKKQPAQLVIEFYGQMVFAFEHSLSQCEREEVQQWESKNSDGLGPITWPGWDTHIGRKLPASVLSEIKRSRLA